MGIEKPKDKKWVIILTLVPFTFALYTQFLWAIVAMNKSQVQADQVQLFLSYFPPFLRDIAKITYSTLLCSILAIIFSSIWMKRDTGNTKAVAGIILVTAILITLLTLFQMM